MRVHPQFNRTALVGWSRDEGQERLTSESLEEILAPVTARLHLPHGLLEKMTGIMGRQLYPADFKPSQAAAAAAEKLLVGLDFDRSRLSLLYSTSVGRDFLEPSTASIIQARLGLGPEVKSLDLGSACLGFIDGLELAALQIEAGLLDYALIVAGENSRMLLENTLSRLLEPEVTVKEYFRNFASLTLGSGGAAMIVGPADRHPDRPRLRSLVSRSDPLGNDLCRGDYGGMETDSTALLNAGVKLARATFGEGHRVFGWEPDSFELIISHQVSEVNTRKFCEALDLPWSRVFKTYPEYGNMGPVAVPFSFDLAWEKGLLQDVHSLAMMGIGSGLCCTMLALEMP